MASLTPSEYFSHQSSSIRRKTRR